MASEGESVSEPFNCQGLPHIFDLEDNCHRHIKRKSSNWEECDHRYCPNSTSAPPTTEFTVPDWAVEVAPWQESEDFAAEFEREYLPGPEHLTELPVSESEGETQSFIEESFFPGPEHLTALPDSETEESESESFSEEEFIEEQLLLPPEEFSLSFFDLHIFSALVMSDIKDSGISVLRKASDYPNWAAQMRGYLTFTEAWPAITAGTPAPENYNTMNARAQGIIIMKTDRSLHRLLFVKSEVAGAEPNPLSAKEMWAALKTQFGSPDAAYVWSQFQGLIKSDDMTDTKPLQDQMNKVRTALQETVNGGVALNENLQALLLMSKLPESYSTLISAIMATTAVQDLKLETIENRVLAEESIRQSGMGQSASKTSQVKKKGKGPCDHCGGSHGSEQCWTKYPHLRPDKKGKGKGKGKGKKEKDKAQTANAGAATQSSSSNGSSSPGFTAGSFVLNSAFGSSPSSLESLLPLVPIVESDSEMELTSSLYISGVNSSEEVSHSRNITEWIMDSGASMTITSYFDDFWEYKPFDQPLVFGTAGSQTIEALGSGTIRGTCTLDDGRHTHVVINNVAWIPKASGRLFSTGCVETSGHTLVQGSGSMVIYDRQFSLGDKVSGQTVLRGMHNPINNLYYLRLNLEKKGSSHAHQLTSSYRLWHRRMGHPSKEAIRRLPQNTKGVDSVGDDTDTSPCEGCQWGKSKRAPFPISTKRATKPLELVHTDLDGPMRTQSVVGHYKYFMSFLDDATSLGRAYYLKEKSDALQAFENFKAWAENVTGHKIIGLRSDRGGEYTSDAFQARLKHYGITHYTTMPGSPQQNGRAERWNQTIVDKAMAIMHHAGLSHGFWQLAVDTAVHIYNRQPMRRLKWRCPITAWDGTIPDISYFRVFGCKAFVHVPKERRQGKLDKKAIEMIFVGYEQGSKGYRFWDPAAHKIVVSRDVIFDEESFPARKDLGNDQKSHGPPIFTPIDSDDEESDNEIPEPLDPIPDLVPPEPVGEPQEPVQEEPEEPEPHQEPVPPPQPVYQRPRRQGAGKNPKRNKDNVYGDEPPASIDRRTDSKGNQRPLRNIETDMMMKALLEAQHGIPQSHGEAMRSSDREKWIRAEKSEMESLQANGTWDLVPRPKNRKVVKNRWVCDQA